MSDNTITVVGNVVEKPELRRTQRGFGVTSFRVASTHRRRDASGTWVDAGTVFLSVSCWRALAENVCDSLEKGDAVIVTGRLSQREFQTSDGARRSAYEIDATAVGPDLTRGVATLRRRAAGAPVAVGEPVAPVQRVPVNGDLPVEVAHS